MQPLNEQMQELRKKRNITIQQLGILADTPHQNVSRLELGKNFKTIELINQILEPLCAHLEVVTDDLPVYYLADVRRIARKGIPKNYWEMNLVNDYMKADSQQEKEAVLRRYCHYNGQNDELKK